MRLGFAGGSAWEDWSFEGTRRQGRLRPAAVVAVAAEQRRRRRRVVAIDEKREEGAREERENCFFGGFIFVKNFV